VLANLLALVLTARWLGPEGRGTVVVITTWVMLFATIGHLSLGQVCVHRAGQQRDHPWLNEAMGALLVVTAGASLIGWAAAAGLYHWGGAALFGGLSPLPLAIGFAALPFLIWEQYSSALLTLIGRLGVYNLNQLVSRTIALVLMAIAILALGWGIYGFLFGYVAGQVMVALAGAIVLWRAVGGRARSTLATVTGFVRDGLKLHLNAIGVLLFSSADVLLIQYFRGLGETGIYQLASQLFLTLLIVPQSALLVLNGKVGKLSRAQLWREQKQMMALVMALMALAALVLALAAGWIVPLLASEAFQASVPILQLLCVGVLAATFNTMMGLQWIVRGLFLQASLLTFAAGFLNCLLNLVLIPRYGAIGAAYASLGGMVLIPFTANLIMFIKVQRDSRGQEPAP
jgi:O-antigen/teichoic acid export membrane protein